MEHFVLPQMFRVEHLTIHYYGLCMAAAVFAGFCLSVWRLKKFGLPEDTADKILLWLLVCGFVGARLYHVFSSLGYYQLHPVEIFQVWHGGLSIFGAILGGFAGLVLFFKKNHSSLSTLHFPLPTFLNWLAPSLLLGQIIGRLGNFFNYEALGYPTNLPWGLYVPEGLRMAGYENFSYFHPFPFYEQVLNLCLLGFILYWEKKNPNSRVTFAAYLIGYGIIRFALEWFRIDHALVFQSIPFNALMSLGLTALGFVFLFISRKKTIF